MAGFFNTKLVFIIVTIFLSFSLYGKVDEYEFNKAKQLYEKGEYSLALEKIMMLLRQNPENKELRELLDKTWNAVLSGKKKEKKEANVKFISEREEIELLKMYRRKQYLYFLYKINNYREDEIRSNKKIHKILKKIEKKMLKYLKKEKPEAWYKYAKIWFNYRDKKASDVNKELNELYGLLKENKSEIDIDFSEIEFFVKNIEKNLKMEKYKELIKEGDRYYKEGNYSKAILFWEKALKLINKNNKSLREKILSKIKNSKEKVFEKRIKKDIEQGIKFYQRGDLASAINIWTSLYNDIENKPKYNNIKVVLGEYIKKAESEYKKLKEINAKKAKEIYDKGLVEYYKGNIDKAIEYWENAYRLNPESAEIREALSKAKFMKKRQGEFQNK